MRYKDVRDGDWFEDAVGYATASGLLGSTEPQKFSPRRHVTRAMLAFCLWRLAGEPRCPAGEHQPDRPAAARSSAALRWADGQGFLPSCPGGRLYPDAPVTREQLVLAVYRYARLCGYDTAPNSAAVLQYRDYASISGSAAPAMSWAVGAGLIWGSGDRLRPRSKATRAQLAAVLQRFRRNTA